jgi:hypothetical protein
MSDAANSEKRVVGRPFPKGQSGNPTGRPKGSLTDILRIILSEVGDTPGITKGQQIMTKLAMMANSGNIDAIKMVLERVDGKVPDLHTVDGRIQINLKWDDGSGD